MNDAEKKARLAEALRQNLRRRKAQMRGQKDGAESGDAVLPNQRESSDGA